MTVSTVPTGEPGEPCSPTSRSSRRRCWGAASRSTSPWSRSRCRSRGRNPKQPEESQQRRRKSRGGQYSANISPNDLSTRLYWLHWNKVPSKSNHSMRVCYISLLSVWSHRKSKCQWHRDNLVLTSQLVCDHNRWMRQTKYILQIKQQ